MRRRSAGVALTVALLFAADIALASHQPVIDPDDTPGRLDVRRVLIEDLQPQQYEVRTYESWRISRIYDDGFFVIYFDTFGDERFDYYVLVRSMKTRLQSTLWRDRQKGNDRRIAYTRVRHPGPRLLRVNVPIGKMRFGPARIQYRWQVRTLFISGKCYERLCIDRAPNGRGMVEPIVPPQ